MPSRTTPYHKPIAARPTGETAAAFASACAGVDLCFEGRVGRRQRTEQSLSGRFGVVAAAGFAVTDPPVRLARPFVC